MIQEKTTNSIIPIQLKMNSLKDQVYAEIYPKMRRQCIPGKSTQIAVRKSLK
jgi:hypothetical protein